MELSKPRQGNKHIPLGCRFGVFSSLFFSFPTSFALTTPKHSTLRPMVPYTHPTNTEDPPPQTTHSRQISAPPMGRSGDRTCQGRSRRNRGRFKGCRRRYRARGSGCGDGTGRPPSPITFAPEERERPISPIEFASSLSTPGVDGVQPDRDKVDGEPWEDTESPSNETGDDDAEVVVIPCEVPPLGGRGGFDDDDAQPRVGEAKQVRTA